MRTRNKYIFVFFITAVIFGAALYVTSYINKQKLEDIRAMQDRVSANLLISESQLGISEEISCSEIDNNYVTKELSELAGRISYAESNGTISVEDLRELKKEYSISQVKDLLLLKRVAERCETPISTILYFYATKEDCSDCVKQGYVLDAIRNKRSDVRIYSFDTTLDLATLTTLKSLYNIEDDLPVIVVNGTPLYGLKNLSDVESVLP